MIFRSIWRHFFKPSEKIVIPKDAKKVEIIEIGESRYAEFIWIIEVTKIEELIYIMQKTGKSLKLHLNGQDFPVIEVCDD